MCILGPAPTQEHVWWRAQYWCSVPECRGISHPAFREAQWDRYFTASELAQLKLDANWIVLSACNTAAGGAEGAEALSGLARAFFYAGARALLVSRWEVDSDAAVALTTQSFATIGRAEALRRSMLALSLDDRNALGGHPSIWARRRGCP